MLCHLKCLSGFQPGGEVFRGTPFLSLPPLLFSFLIVVTVTPSLSLSSFLESLCPLFPLIFILWETKTHSFLLLVMTEKTCHIFGRHGMTEEQPFGNPQGTIQKKVCLFWFFLLHMIEAKAFIPFSWSRTKLLASLDLCYLFCKRR